MPVIPPADWEIMLLETEQKALDAKTHVTWEVYHNRVEAIVTRWNGDDWITLAKVNSFSHDSLGEVISKLLIDAGYENGIMIADWLGLYPSAGELRDVTVQWLDSGEQFDTVVSIGGSSDEEDTRVFFYFADEEEFESAKAKAGDAFEFRIIS